MLDHTYQHLWPYKQGEIEKAIADELKHTKSIVIKFIVVNGSLEMYKHDPYKVINNGEQV